LVTAGIDIGSLTAKAVILDFEAAGLLGQSLMATGRSPEQAGALVLSNALDDAGLQADAVRASVATGYGRGVMQGVERRITEISCHARGARHVVPGARTVIDLGGQDAKVISLDEMGRPLDFEMNDRCAAGTGRFLEVMAGALDVSVGQFGELANSAETAASLSSTCTVFAESEVIGLLTEGRPVAEIAAGLCNAIAQRTLHMANRLRVEPPVVLCGGVALNAGVRRAIDGALGMEVIVPEGPQLVGALGAALLAGEMACR